MASLTVLGTIDFGVYRNVRLSGTNGSPIYLTVVFSDIYPGNMFTETSAKLWNGLQAVNSHIIMDLQHATFVHDLTGVRWDMVIGEEMSRILKKTITSPKMDKTRCDQQRPALPKTTNNSQLSQRRPTIASSPKDGQGAADLL